MESTKSNIWGSEETLNSRSFLTRKSEKKIRYATTIKNCKDYLPHEWAEYRTSLLMVALYQNPKSTFDLKLFMHKMIINLISSLNLDLQYELERYINELNTAKQNERARSYPVAQSQVWIPGQNIAGIWNDVYGLINFTKWLWSMIYNGTYYTKENCDEVSLNDNLMIEIFQQKMFKIQNALRGYREDIKTSDKDKTPYVGISPFKNEILKKTVNSLVNPTIEPWIHPGSKKCFVADFGGYGAMIKSYRENNDQNIKMYSSLQCGISGSVNYFVFLYLLSTNIVSDTNTRKNLQRLFLIISLQLAGDGGHNFREIIFGITVIAIVLHHIISDIKKQLISHYKKSESLSDNIKLFMNDSDSSWAEKDDGILKLLIQQFTGKDGIGTKLNDCRNVDKNNSESLKKYLFITMLNSLVNWEKSITILYEITADINIVGLNEKDLTEVGLKINQTTFNLSKKEVYKIFFVEPKVLLTNTQQINNLQTFFALDNDRYKKSKEASFQKSPDVLLNNIVDALYPGLVNVVDDNLQETYSKCYNGAKPYIPFA